MKYKSNLRGLDLNAAKDKIVGFLKEHSPKAGYVLGLSGGIDSAATFLLANEAIGDRLTVMVLPDVEATPQEDIDDAVDIATYHGINHKLINITPIIKLYSQYLPYDKLAFGNLKARVRMALLYYEANVRGQLVLGTGDKSELLLGYFTKYGDGAADLLPIVDVYKSELRELATLLGVPNKIVQKKSSPRLWLGQDAEAELGIEYTQADKILVEIIERGTPIEEVQDKFGKEPVTRVYERYKNSTHKRAMPLYPKLI
ncbi:MAG: NAD+ synthase [Nitrososphaerota archaeon]|jgi:NAD+ synthase|nr:NAD+ synthase [Nitrososphaerota archaeon]MDG7038482.1 NAD+ synthase [Nitrososphaerota archaeon]MDG7039794.1 NAD+ synthase [Nitrososphaerota archaeon]MDG7041895.1 NAD+ synthase [Nitrososphaerota archaeon]